MIKEIFLAIQAKLMDANIGIRHFDWYNGQYESDNTPGFTASAVFIEFQPIQPKSLSNKIQRADVVFRLHYVTERTSHTQHGVREQNNGLAHLEGVDKINKLIHGFNFSKPESEQEGAPLRQVFNSCSRTDLIPDHSQSNLIVHLQEYRTVAYDYSAAKVYSKAEPQPRLAWI